MKRFRYHPMLIKVWHCLIYAIGGRADGLCERFDVNLNQWEFITTHPEPMGIMGCHGVNLEEKWVYLVGGSGKLWRLDVEKAERDIGKGAN